MRRCDCFHPQMDMTLLNVSKFDFKETQRPCNLLDGGEEKSFFCMDHLFPEKFASSEFITFAVDEECTLSTLNDFDTPGKSFCSSCHMSCRYGFAN